MFLDMSQKTSNKLDVRSQLGPKLVPTWYQVGNKLVPRESLSSVIQPDNIDPGDRDDFKPLEKAPGFLQSKLSLRLPQLVRGKGGNLE